MQAAVHNRDTRTLANEEKQDQLRGLHSTQDLMNANALKMGDFAASQNETTVIFNDAHSGARVTLNLSKNNVDKLRENFAVSDFYERSDGALRLNGNAEAFVGGWFGDIMYQQNYLSADLNKNGRISTTESNQLKNSTFSGLFGIESSATEAIKAYQKFSKQYGDNADLSLKDIVNHFIETDSNLDGLIDTNTELKDSAEATLSMQSSMQKAIIKSNNIVTLEAKLDSVSIEDMVAEKEHSKDEDVGVMMNRTTKTAQDTQKQAEEIARSIKSQQAERKAMLEKVRMESEKKRQEHEAQLQHNTNNKSNAFAKLNKNLASVIDEIKSHVKNKNIKLMDIKV